MCQLGFVLDVFSEPNLWAASRDLSDRGGLWYKSFEFPWRFVQ